jgi:predicted dehydrogenase
MDCGVVSSLAPSCIQWGILGVGDVCEVKSGPGFQKANGSRLVAVMRRTPGAADDFAARHGTDEAPISAYTDANALLAHEGLDAVYVATPPGSHMELALKVCAAGKPCLVEKPLARTAAESRIIVAAFEAAGVPLFVSYYRRGQPRFLKARELVASGAIGALTDITYRQSRSDHVSSSEPDSLAAAGAPGSTLPWRLDPAIAGGGLIMDVGCHALDAIDYIAGNISDASGDAWRRGDFPSTGCMCEDVVHLHAACGEAKVPLSASWNFAAAGGKGEDLFTFNGTRGVLRFSCFGTEPMVVEDALGCREEYSFEPLPHVAQ